ncbi:hypothetical protein QWI17_20005 [Gilvimarinus sp. SDUM040013]|uniref:Uncharacterized protein n=1 Tax=Gilvimarinus gilvus TaxID=3058038 RepID=A0ABU4RZF8_9GAMM|nr:hypothetical protein [Gilvimarinus sp. SDUM040013]MDO3388140.1 hypothetical protein [Gilvimarinus sp. SDUM040013]MDX6850285.1 hypothetical protein [Gilvimarinus sp. SDUM040013]
MLGRSILEAECLEFIASRLALKDIAIRTKHKSIGLRKLLEESDILGVLMLLWQAAESFTESDLAIFAALLNTKSPAQVIVNKSIEIHEKYRSQLRSVKLFSRDWYYKGLS